MTRWGTVLGLAVLATILDMSVSPLLQHGSQPSFGLVLVVLLGLRGDWRTSVLAGLFVGGLQDLIAGRHVGLHILALVAAGWLSSWVSGQVYQGSYLTRFGIGALAAAVQGVVGLAAEQMLGAQTAWVPGLEGLYTSLLWTGSLLMLTGRLESYLAGRPTFTDVDTGR